MKHSKKPLAAFLIATVFAMTACAHQKTKEELAEHPESAPPKKAAAKSAGPTIEAKSVAAEEEANYVVEIGFAKGHKELNRKNRSRLATTVEQAGKRGQISEFEVIAWADTEYPSVHTKKLAKSQVQLAAERGREIQNFLKSKDGHAQVSIFNMAERPNALADLFGTKNASVKKALEVAGIPNTDTSVKSPAKASKAIVLIILNQ